MDFPIPKAHSNSASQDAPSQGESIDFDEKARKAALLQARKDRRNASHKLRMETDAEYREAQRARRAAYRRKKKDEKAEAREAARQIQREVSEGDEEQRYSPYERRVEKKKPGRLVMLCKWHGL